MKEYLVEGNLNNLFQEPQINKSKNRFNKLIDIFIPKKARATSVKYKLPPSIEEGGLIEPLSQK